MSALSGCRVVRAVVARGRRSTFRIVNRRNTRETRVVIWCRLGTRQPTRQIQMREGRFGLEKHGDEMDGERERVGWGTALGNGEISGGHQIGSSNYLI